MNEEKRKQYTANLTKELPALRKMLGVSQASFANIVGLSKSTIGNMECGRQPMTWSSFLAILTVVKANPNTNRFLETMGIYDNDLNEFLSGKMGTEAGK